MGVPGLVFPNGGRFAFTVIDDTDVATRENVEPIYRLLAELGFHTTKTVWMMPWTEGYSDFEGSETIEDDSYREFVLGLQKQGFEIASHGARMESSNRDVTMRAVKRFREVFGSSARVYANHAYNRENVYWGVDRVDHWLLRLFYAYTNGRQEGWYQGHTPGSDYWWGDICHAEHAYVRNLTFDEVNLLRINPSMPYTDPARPYVRSWYSASDADNCNAFNRLLRPDAQERLEREGGVCLVATHLGKGFVTNGRPNPETERLLRMLAARNGWFPTVGQLLDFLSHRKPAAPLPPGEWRRMQWRWAIDLVRSRLANSFPGISRSRPHG